MACKPRPIANLVLALLICVGSVAGGGALHAEAREQDALALLLGGKWSHEPPVGGLCKSPFWWELDAGGKRLTVHLSEPIQSRDSFGDTFYYDILNREAGRLFMFMHHETLRTDGGALVRWYLIFDGADRYVWLREDHPVGWWQGVTYRCPLTG
ncbi:hypothetical protein N4R57_17140 [Rhodobacteraceae bacterium D3-12]|nr:hypothetical protein N4R57_17140 [Rhodobacteraceae bacterium D3-12]